MIWRKFSAKYSTPWIRNFFFVSFQYQFANEVLFVFSGKSILTFLSIVGYNYQISRVCLQISIQKGFVNTFMWTVRNFWLWKPSAKVKSTFQSRNCYKYRVNHKFGNALFCWLRVSWWKERKCFRLKWKIHSLASKWYQHSHYLITGKV